MNFSCIIYNFIIHNKKKHYNGNLAANANPERYLSKYSETKYIMKVEV